MKKNFVFLVLLLTNFSCKQNNEYKAYLSDPKLFCDAVHELNSVVMGNNFPPMVAARNYAYASIAAYETIAKGYPDKYASLAGQIHGLTAMPMPDTTKPINYDLAALLSYIKVGEAVTFPQGSMQDYLNNILQTARDKGMPEDVEQASEEFSDTIVKAILAWTMKDHYLETRSATKYSVIDTPGRWVPTPPMYASAVEPHWKDIRTLVLDSADMFPPPPPPPFNIKDTNSFYYHEVMLSKHITDTLTPEEAFTADFWDDNPFKLNVSGHIMFANKKFSPAGHWNGVIGIAAIKAHFDFPATVYAYAETNIALFDAFIQCWWAKFTYNTVRPETVIDKYIDFNWRPHLQTPAFPEYTCGHCVISGAATEVLTHVFGDNFHYTDSTEMEFGINNRSFTSFKAAANETAISRFYGGIHFKNSTEISHNMGVGVGDYIVQKLTMKK